MEAASVAVEPVKEPPKESEVTANLRAAVRAQLADLLREDAEFTPAVAMRIANAARLGSDLLIAITNPRGGVAAAASNIFGSNTSAGLYSQPATIAYAPPAETYGAQAIQELMETAKGFLKPRKAPRGPDVVDLVNAVATAKNASLSATIVAKLEAELEAALGPPAKQNGTAAPPDELLTATNPSGVVPA